MAGITGNPNHNHNRLYGVTFSSMNSKERHEARYQRRKQKRLQRQQTVNDRYGVFDDVFTFDNLYESFKKCCCGVNWKSSTQRYKANALQNIAETLSLLQNNKYKSRGFYEFDIVERGKARHIKSVHIFFTRSDV